MRSSRPPVKYRQFYIGNLEGGANHACKFCVLVPDGSFSSCRRRDSSSGWISPAKWNGPYGKVPRVSELSPFVVARRPTWQRDRLFVCRGSTRGLSGDACPLLPTCLPLTARTQPRYCPNLGPGSSVVRNVHAFQSTTCQLSSVLRRESGGWCESCV